MVTDTFPVEADAGLLSVLTLADVQDGAVRAWANFSAVGAGKAGKLALHFDRPRKEVIPYMSSNSMVTCEVVAS